MSAFGLPEPQGGGALFGCLMLDNHLYNLMLQLTEENKSLWRIKNHYQGDAGDCADCKAFWDKMEKDKEDHIRELTGLVKKHLG